MQNINDPRFNPWSMEHGAAGNVNNSSIDIVIVLVQILKDESGNYIHILLICFISTIQDLFLYHNFVSEDTLKIITQTISQLVLQSLQIWPISKYKLVCNGQRIQPLDGFLLIPNYIKTSWRVKLFPPCSLCWCTLWWRIPLIRSQFILSRGNKFFPRRFPHCHKKTHHSWKRNHKG